MKTQPAPPIDTLAVRIEPAAELRADLEPAFARADL